MNRKELKFLLFCCWQLKINTLGQLAKWRVQHNANTNSQTLQALAKAYNGKEWAEANPDSQNSGTAGTL